MTDTTPNKTNSEQALADLKTQISEFGCEAKHGGDALPKFGFAIVQAAVDGIIDDAPVDDGNDDAYRMYDIYARAESNKPIHAHTTRGIKSQASKTRQLIKLGMSTKCDAMEVIETAAELRNEMADADEAVKPAYHALVDVARAQGKSDSQLTHDEMRGCIAKPDAKEKTVETEVQRVFNTLDTLITGERKDGLQTVNEDVVKAHDALGTFLQMLNESAELEALKERAAELGLSLGESDELEALTPGTMPTADEVKEARIVKKEDV